MTTYLWLFVATMVLVIIVTAIGVRARRKSLKKSPRVTPPPSTGPTVPGATVPSPAAPTVTPVAARRRWGWVPWTELAVVGVIAAAWLIVRMVGLFDSKPSITWPDWDPLRRPNPQSDTGGTSVWLWLLLLGVVLLVAELLLRFRRRPLTPAGTTPGTAPSPRVRTMQVHWPRLLLIILLFLIVYLLLEGRLGTPVGWWPTRFWAGNELTTRILLLAALFLLLAMIFRPWGAPVVTTTATAKPVKPFDARPIVVALLVAAAIAAMWYLGYFDEWLRGNEARAILLLLLAVLLFMLLLAVLRWSLPAFALLLIAVIFFTFLKEWGFTTSTQATVVAPRPVMVTSLPHAFQRVVVAPVGSWSPWVDVPVGYRFWADWGSACVRNEDENGLRLSNRNARMLRYQSCDKGEVVVKITFRLM